MHSSDLRRRFNEWELRLRSCPKWEHRVPIEPPFEPLFAERRIDLGVVDDGRRAGLFERLKGKHQTPIAPPALPVPYPTPPIAQETDRVELQLLLPSDLAVKREMARALGESFRRLNSSASFEIVRLADTVIVQFCCAAEDSVRFTSTMRSYFPNAKLRLCRDWLKDRVLAIGGVGCIATLGLANRTFFALRAPDVSTPDALTEIVNVLEELPDDQLGLVQILFVPSSAPWRSEFENFFESAESGRNVLPFVRQKFSEELFAVSVRIGAFGNDAESTRIVAQSLARSIILATRSPDNELEFIDTSLDDFETELGDMLHRETHRSGMLWSLPELISIVHPPASIVGSRLLARKDLRSKAAPHVATNGQFVLGTNAHDDITVPVSLSVDQRLRHTYLVGASGTGKSTLLLSMILQDISAGNGVAVLDPHGDLIDDIVAQIPESRTGDVILLDPSDEEFPIGFNVLTAHSELERTLLSSDLVAAFRRLSTTFGDQMASVLGYSVLAFLESSRGGTLLDLRRFLLDKAFRAEFLKSVSDVEVVNYWEREFPLVRGAPHASILARLNTFLRSKLIRHMVAQRDDKLDMRRIMDGRQIFLARLSQGAIGEENAHLLGSLLVARIAQAAMSRQDTSMTERAPFFCYIDEFHHFITPSIAAILSGTRKYGVGLTLGHQETRQVKNRSDDAMSAILSNAYTRIMFRLGEGDAREMASSLSYFQASDLMNLGIGDAVVRVERPGYDFNLNTVRAADVDPTTAARRRLAVVQSSRTSYARPRSDIESELRKERGVTTSAPAVRRQHVPALTESDVSSNVASSTAIGAPNTGRGGTQHKYLQSLVKRLAEDRGFAVAIEREVLDGHGYVDVTLERDRLRIGCEISVTTRASHEIENLAKVLASGFDVAVLISSDRRVLDRAARALHDVDRHRIRLCLPDELGDFLDDPLVTIPIMESSSEKPRTKKEANKRAKVIGNSKEMLTPVEAAEYLGLAVQTLAKMRVSGEGAPFSKLGRLVVYDRADLDSWIASRRRSSTSEQRRK